MFNTAYFSLEISNEMIVSRLLGQESGIKPTRIMTGKLTEEEKLRQIEAQGRLSIYNDNMVFIDDKYYLGEILKTINDNNFDFIVIDFIQNVMDRGDEYEKLSKVALELQKIAKKKNCCIAILSQLSNSAYKTDALEYKGSGSIATVCDLGIFVIRKEDSLDKMTLKVRKNRRGRSGIEVELQNFYPSGRIVEL
jgi:replicative DNA helicase